MSWMFYDLWTLFVKSLFSEKLDWETKPATLQPVEEVGANHYRTTVNVIESETYWYIDWYYSTSGLLPRTLCVLVNFDVLL